MENLVHQMLDHQYPDHPRFDVGAGKEVTNANVAVVLEYVRTAVDKGGRVDPVEQSKRSVLRAVANPLKCGEALENHYVFDAANFPWRNRFTKLAGQDGYTSEIPIKRIWEWLAPTGMSQELQNLLILAWALLDDKEFARHGAAVTVNSVRDVREDYVLRNPVLPDESAWATARTRATTVLGETPPVALTAANVRALASGVRLRADGWNPDCVDLLKLLREHASVLGLDETQPRMADAVLACDLLGKLAGEGDDLVVVNALAEAALPAEPQSVATSMASARAVAASLKGASWRLLEAFAERADAGDAQAVEVMSGLREAARTSELHRPLGPVLVSTIRRIEEILADGGSDGGSDDKKERIRIDDIELDAIDSTLDTLRGQIHDALRENSGKKARIEWWLE
jgi:hypothetical protein